MIYSELMCIQDMYVQDMFNMYGNMYNNMYNNICNNE